VIGLRIIANLARKNHRHIENYISSVALLLFKRQEYTVVERVQHVYTSRARARLAQQVDEREKAAVRLIARDAVQITQRLFRRCRELFVRHIESSMLPKKRASLRLSELALIKTKCMRVSC